MAEKKYRIIIEGSYNSTKATVAKKAIEKLMLTAQENLDHVSKGCAFTTLAKVSVEDPQDVIQNSWCTEDIISRAQERHIRISKKVAQKILAEMNHKFDAMQGINWDVIDCYIDSRND